VVQQLLALATKLKDGGLLVYLTNKILQHLLTAAVGIVAAVFFSGPLGGEISPPKFEISPPNRQA